MRSGLSLDLDDPQATASRTDIVGLHENFRELQAYSAEEHNIGFRCLTNQFQDL